MPESGEDYKERKGKGREDMTATWVGGRACDLMSGS
jgi:hypothetical protein